ncbi:12370_t:CDS:2, partial [Dentiscutata erythropus]
MERLEALAVLDKFAVTRQKKLVPTLPIIRGVNDGSNGDNKELFSFVETEAAPENHDQPLAETIRQHIDYPSPPIDCNSFFTRDAYEKYSFYSFHRTCEIFSMHKEKNTDISVQKISDKVDNVTDKLQINEQIMSPIRSDGDDLVMDDQCSEDESNEIKQKIDVQEDISEKQSKEIESQESVYVSEKQVKVIEIQKSVDVFEKQSKEVETQESVDVSEKQSKE